MAMASASGEEDNSFPYPIQTEGGQPDAYTEYTVKRLSMEPLKRETESRFGPVYNRIHFDYKINPAWRCNGRFTGHQTNSLFVLVMSNADNFDQRQAVRDTWVKHLANQSAINYAFLVGLDDWKSVEKRLGWESERYGDVIQVDHKVDYDSNLSTMKSMAMLYWAAKHCRRYNFIMKADDRVYLNRYTLTEVIESLDPDKEAVYGGRSIPEPYMFDAPLRHAGSQWQVTEEAWPWTSYPIYVAGSMYWMSMRTVDSLLEAAEATPHFPFEDLYLHGLCAPKAGIKLYTTDRIVVGIPNKGPENPDACYVESFLSWLAASVEEMKAVHNATDQRFRLKATRCEDNELHDDSLAKPIIFQIKPTEQTFRFRTIRQQ